MADAARAPRPGGNLFK